MTKLESKIKKDIKKLEKYKTDIEKEIELVIKALTRDGMYVYDVRKHINWKSGVRIISREHWYVRLINLITNPIVYLFTGNVRW